MRLKDDSHYDFPVTDLHAAGDSSASIEAEPAESDDAKDNAAQSDAAQTPNSPTCSESSTEESVEPTDEQLVARVRDGDQSACEWVVRRYAPRMLSTARRMLNSEADALDAVQDAFLSAFRTIDSFEGRAQLGSWLYRIVVNAALMKLRRRRRRKERSIEDLLPTYSDNGTLSDHIQSWRLTHDETIETREMRQLVRNCIDELPELYRAVLLLRDIEELSTDEVADALELTPAGVRTRLHRARQALKSLLDEHMTELPA